MPISAQCPSCKANFRLTDEMAGKKVKCQKCENVFAVPQATEEAAAKENGATGNGAPKKTTLGKTPAKTRLASDETGIADVAKSPPKARSRDGDEGNGRRTSKSSSPPPLKKSDSDRPPSKSRRQEREPQRNNSSMMGILLVLGGGAALLSCCVCSGGVGYLVFAPGSKKPATDPVQVAAGNDPGKNEVPIKIEEAPKKKKKDGGNNPPAINPPAINPPAINPPAFNPPAINPPAFNPVGGINVVFGPDGTFRSDTSLNATDPQARIIVNNPIEKRHKLYVARMELGRSYQIDMTSKQMDPFLYVTDEANNFVALDDDGGGFPNARIIIRPNRTGNFRIYATSFSGLDMGGFTLIVRRL